MALDGLYWNEQNNGELSLKSNKKYSKILARSTLYNEYSHIIKINEKLNRSIVSNQANKNIPFYRWLKYKEAFSCDLVEFVLNRFKPSGISNPKVLDPFTGMGTTLTSALKAGWCATGIEILPLGTASIQARLIAQTVNLKEFEKQLNKLKNCKFSKSSSCNYHFPHIRITEKAFPKETETAISIYQDLISNIKDRKVRYLFRFACLSVLEEVSFTRKDGQYLRWDSRSERSLKSKFNKGFIPDFKTAIIKKLIIMFEDIKHRSEWKISSQIELIEGSCLRELPKLKDCQFHLVLTSPPYCNRYDYTRTYALELAFLGCDDDDIKNLRQDLLSCTVENKTKRNILALEYASQNRRDFYEAVVDAFEKQEAVQEVLKILYKLRDEGQLNNNNIPQMIENYLFEMSFVIHELARVLTVGGHIVMVNDNVQYNGEEVPIDLILSDFAKSAGLSVDNIWVLPKGKGNSSQQMGTHGRNEIRKCVYIWSKKKNARNK